MEETKRVRENYNLDDVPGREKVWEFESADRYPVISFIKSSETRQQVFELVATEPRTTGEIARELGIETETAYYHIRCLRKGEKVYSDKQEEKRYPPLVEDKTPHKQRNKLYGVTDDGLNVAKWLQNGD